MTKRRQVLIGPRPTSRVKCLFRVKGKKVGSDERARGEPQRTLLLCTEARWASKFLRLPGVHFWLAAAAKKRVRSGGDARLSGPV